MSIDILMMMKKTKSIMAITLITFLGMSAFIQPAEARRRISNTYSRSSQQQTYIQAQFSLVDITRNGNLIGDQEPENDSVGLFIGAIEDYNFGVGYLRQGENAQIVLSSSGNPIFDTPFTSNGTGFNVGNLEAQFLASNPLFGGRDTIQYSIFNPETPDFVVSYTLDFLNPGSFGFFPEISLPSSFDKYQAVNCLTYILENNLLALTEPSDPSLGGLTEIILQNQTEEEIPDSTATGVPEPSSTAGLLAFGVLGAGALLKRKIKSAKH